MLEERGKPVLNVNELKGKLEALASNDAVAEALNAAGSNEEVLKILKDNGLEVTADDMDEVVKALQTSAPEGELGENDLENVAGGIGLGTAIGIVRVGKWLGKWVYTTMPIKPNSSRR